METGQKKIMLLRHPQDRRYRSRCMQCRDPVPAKSDYCSPSCKVLHRPNGQNAQIIQDLVNTDFTQEPVRDRFCLICLRAFASAHCPNHALHLHGADGEEAGAAPNPAPDILEILEHDGWKLVPGDALGPLQDLLKRINVNGVQMVAVRRRHMQDAQGANVCANLTCNESVDEAGDLCCIQCFFDMQFPMQGEEEEEEPQSPPQDSEGEDED